MIRGLIFDFDGLILDTETPAFQSWQEIFREHGCDLTLEAWAHTIGSSEYNDFPLKELERRLGYSVDHSLVLARQRERENYLIMQQPPLPGVHAYLQRARELGLKLAIASSSSCTWVEGHLTRLGLREFFACIRARDDVLRTKPDPQLYLQALDCLQLPAQQVVVFEDSPHGIHAAKSAGLFCVAIPNALTRHLDTSRADMHLSSFNEIPLDALLQRVDELHMRAK